MTSSSCDQLVHQDPFRHSLLANERWGEKFVAITATLKQVCAVSLLHSKWGQSPAIFLKASHIF